eukprot:6770176-Alexandrium_andersonii.AAC.1
MQEGTGVVVVHKLAVVHLRNAQRKQVIHVFAKHIHEWRNDHHLAQVLVLIWDGVLPDGAILANCVHRDAVGPVVLDSEVHALPVEGVLIVAALRPVPPGPDAETG